MKENCLFCEIFETNNEVIYENEYFYARYDLFPVSPGHTEIVPKRHIVSLFELSQVEWENLYEALRETVKVIETTDFENIYTKLLGNPINEKAAEYYRKMLTHVGLDKKPDGYNIGNNEGEAAGRTVNHLHVHIIPRYIGDVTDPRGGIRHIIPEMGNYK